MKGWIAVLAVGAALLATLALGGGTAFAAEQAPPSPDPSPPAPDDGSATTSTVTDGTMGDPVQLNLTGYYPKWAQAHGTAAQQRMEGAPVDRKGRPVHTLEEHIADPVAHPYVSLAGDFHIWPYGQRLVIPALGEPSDEWKAQTGEQHYVCRVVDTGGHFFGPNKVYRHPGYEPIDVCVDGPDSMANIGAGGPTDGSRVEGDTL